jgi:hypothetical protein
MSAEKSPGEADVDVVASAVEPTLSAVKDETTVVSSTPSALMLGGKQISDFVDKAIHSPLERRLFQPGTEHAWSTEHARIKEAIR